MHRSTLSGSAVVRRVSSVAARPRSSAPGQDEGGHFGLYLICSVEMFERLGSGMVFYLLVLYFNEYLGLGSGWAARATSYLHMLSYAAGMLGGLLGDRRLGSRRAALAGLALLAFGYSTLGAVQHSLPGLIAAACLVIAGSGFFKPNCTALLGALYPHGHLRRAAAFNWFYYAINLGSMAAPFLGGLVRASNGWGAMFRLAAGCLVIAWGLLGLGGRYLAKPASVAVIPATAAVTSTSSENDTLTSASRMAALVLVLSVLALFGAVLSQGYGILLLWVRDEARRTMLGYQIPPDFFAALPAALVLICGPLLARLTGMLSKRGVLLGEPLLFTCGMLLCALAYGLMIVASLFTHGSGLASPLWLVGCKVGLALGELLGVPVALALADSLARSRTKGLTLGLSYGSHALGFWLGGEIAALWPRCSHAAFFALLTGGCVAAAVVIYAQARWLTRVLADNRIPRHL